MGDFTFKISGTSEPFIARLWNSTCTCVSACKYTEYSGQTVQFGNLLGSTCYNVSVTDSIGSVVWTGFTTPTALVAPELPDVYMDMNGLLWSPVSYICVVSDCTGGNCPPVFCVHPALQENQSVSFDVDLITCNTIGTTNSISLHCKPQGASTYTSFASYNNAGCCTRTLCLNYGDSICYTLSTACNSGAATACGYSCLCLTSITGTCVNATIAGRDNWCTSVNYVTTTTTTTTTLAPITVCLSYLDATTYNSTVCNVQGIVCGCVKLSRALVSGESVRLCYVVNTLAENGLAQSTHAACARGWVDRLNTNECYSYTCISVPYNYFGTCTCQRTGYLDVNYSNQATPKVFCTNTFHHYLDTCLLDGYTCSVVRLTNAVLQAGANFAISGTYDRVGVLQDVRWDSINSALGTGIFPIRNASGPSLIDGIVLDVQPDIQILKGGLEPPSLPTE